MKIRCAQCGEELLGAVNRCWKCSKTFPIVTGDPLLPPVRRRVTPVGAVEPALATASQGGSPFTAEYTALLDARMAQTPLTPAASPARRPVYPNSGAATGAAQGALTLGLFSLALALWGMGVLALSLAAVIVALVGLIMGIWGMSSPRRGVSLTGVILCCIALSLSSFQSLVQAYVNTYGISPFQEDESLFLEQEDQGTKLQKSNAP